MADSEGLFAASMASSAVHIQENNKLREMETRIADLSRKAARERSNLERRHDDETRRLNGEMQRARSELKKKEGELRKRLHAREHAVDRPCCRMDQTAT